MDSKIHPCQTLIEPCIGEPGVSIRCLTECVHCLAVFPLSEPDDPDIIPESGIVGIGFEKCREQGECLVQPTGFHEFVCRCEQVRGVGHMYRVVGSEG